MGNSLRCCIACVLPCGALDVIRIVHLNGQVDEFSRPISAQEILDANPGHVLSRPCSSQDPVGAGRILIVSPESDLKRGGFYFLIPSVSVPDKKKKSKAHRINNRPKEKEEEKKVTGSGPPRRKRSGRVGVWRPHLESISEDL